MIIVGVLALGAIFTLRQSQRQQEQVIAPAQQEQAISAPVATPTSTATMTPTPTETPLPTPTPTKVVVETLGAESVVNTPTPGGIQDFLPTAEATLAPDDVTPTNTRVVGNNATSAAEEQPAETTPEAPADGSSPVPAEMPAGGGVLSSEGTTYLIWVGLGMLGLLVLGATRYLRQ